MQARKEKYCFSGEWIIKLDASAANDDASTGVVIGAVIGSIVGALLIGVLVYYFVVRPRPTSDMNGVQAQKLEDQMMSYKQVNNP